MSTDQPKIIAPLDLFIDLWYNKCKENSENQTKSVHVEGKRNVSIQQWADQSVGFSAANGYAAAGRQPLSEKGTDDPLG